MTYETFPDAEAIAVAVLADADVCEGRVYGELPAALTLPAALVTRIGGIAVERHRLDSASVQVSVWADTKVEAHDAAAAARTALHQAEGTTVSYGDGSGFVTAVEDTTGLQYAADPSADFRHRYVFGVSIFTHA